MNNQEARTLAEGIAETVIDILIPNKARSPYDGEPINTNLTEEETEELLAALEEQHADNDQTVMVPVDRDWAATFAHNIRRQERSLAEKRLRARMAQMFTPSFVDELAEVINPPERTDS